MRLYDNSESANGYKVQLLASFLGLPLEVLQVDIFSGKSRTPEFLAVNPAGQVPLLASSCDTPRRIIHAEQSSRGACRAAATRWAS